MKSLTIILISFLFSFSSALDIKAQTQTGQQFQSIKLEVEAIFQEMLISAEKLDYDKLSSGVDDSRNAGFIVNGKYYSRYSLLIDDLKLSAQGIGKQDISIKEKKTTVLSDKIVLMTVSGVSKATLPDSREITARFNWSFVFEKISNNWKVIYSHQSTT